MSRQKPVYLRQKPILYFDENFPQPIVELVKGEQAGQDVL